MKFWFSIEPTNSMKKLVGPLGMTDEERADAFRTRKWPERTIEAPDRPPGEPTPPASALAAEAARTSRAEVGRPGGKARGEVRRQKADEWKTWVTAEAPKIRTADPTVKLTQEQLADKLIALATKQGIIIPEQGSVVKHLSAMKKAGQLS